ncbi:hypothetical protein E1212_10415 [Jiangella ureilytica]|uniref:Uncharacterized protein n=1 Tax=Jiangella ureilytica TaxID=2530374 RepID=A0A4R4RQ43_9ACTN|nr:hypothetical protein [Jiangella ureilytica]TDC52011.1 hypothetical protein E1212_10415 [Jiangella ureilytica]
MVPSNSTLVGIADRAGYPVLTVPAGEGTGNAGRNPIGVTFVEAAGSEASLLAAGYAFEQGHSYVRRAPGVTNPSMWRCTRGGSFFTGELCNPATVEKPWPNWSTVSAPAAAGPRSWPTSRALRRTTVRLRLAL